MQYVSSTPATRLDVINMQQDLDQRLAERKSKETGICAVREELYGQTFDELIRQVFLSLSLRNISLLGLKSEDCVCFCICFCAFDKLKRQYFSFATLRRHTCLTSYLPHTH